MTLHYQTEYCLSGRGRVCRTYHGVQALIAIGLDILLGLSFGLVGLGMRLVRFLTVRVYRAFVALASLPWKISRIIARQFVARPVFKPTWATFDEL